MSWLQLVPEKIFARGLHQVTEHILGPFLLFSRSKNDNNDMYSFFDQLWKSVSQMMQELVPISCAFMYTTISVSVIKF